jgi:hypothetical protein
VIPAQIRRNQRINCIRSKSRNRIRMFAQGLRSLSVRVCPKAGLAVNGNENDKILLLRPLTFCDNNPAWYVGI